MRHIFLQRRIVLSVKSVGQMRRVNNLPRVASRQQFERATPRNTILMTFTILRQLHNLHPVWRSTVSWANFNCIRNLLILMTFIRIYL